MSVMTLAIAAVVIVALTIFVRKLTTPLTYPEVDLADIDRDALFDHGLHLLSSSETWPLHKSAGGVEVRSSLEPYPVRAVRYQVEAEADFERAVAYVKNLCDCVEKTRHTKDKIEETVYDKNRGGDNHEWVRRSVHMSPPPGRTRDALVVYFERRPEPKRYQIAFQSVDAIDGTPIPAVEGATRFMVNPAIYELDEPTPGHVRVRKVEAVDPTGMVGPMLNNYFISTFFFRNYMFDEAKAMRDSLIA